VFNKLGRLYSNFRTNKAIKQGMKVGENCRIIGRPNFGSEPYLISIGNHVTVSSNVTFLTHDGGTWVLGKIPVEKRILKFGRITIHDNCFIGHGTIILPGVTIGPNSVIGTGSIVTKDVPAGEIWAGVPAKFITTYDEYAKKAIENTPNYDVEAFKRNKKETLLKEYPYPW